MVVFGKSNLIMSDKHIYLAEIEEIMTLVWMEYKEKNLA